MLEKALLKAVKPWKAIQWALCSLFGDKPGRKYTELLKLADRENVVEETADALAASLVEKLGVAKVDSALDLAK